MAIYHDAKDLVKDTPLLLLSPFMKNQNVKIYAKLECQIFELCIIAIRPTMLHSKIIHFVFEIKQFFSGYFNTVHIIFMIRINNLWGCLTNALAKTKTLPKAALQIPCCCNTTTSRVFTSSNLNIMFLELFDPVNTIFENTNKYCSGLPNQCFGSNKNTAHHQFYFC